MDLVGLGSAEWSDIGSLLTSLWIVVALVVIFATNMLIGHIFIPSMVSTLDLPRVAHKARPVFYTLAVISIGAALVVFVRVIDLADVLSRFWDSYWI